MPLIDRYGVYGICRLALDTVISRFLYFNIRIMRCPFYIRGKRHIRIGDNFTAGVGLRMDAFSEKKKICIEIGKNAQVNDYVHICAVESVKIGNNVLIASKVFITDHNHGSYGHDNTHDNPDTPPIKRPLFHAPVEIEDNVWIGEFVAVLPGVKIGRGAVIGAMSVVTKDIPSYSIAVGAPAKVVKKYDFINKKWERV